MTDRHLMDLVQSERTSLVPPQGSRAQGWDRLQQSVADGVEPPVDVAPPARDGPGWLAGPIKLVALVIAIGGIAVATIQWVGSDDTPEVAAVASVPEPPPSAPAPVASPSVVDDSAESPEPESRPAIEQGAPHTPKPGTKKATSKRATSSNEDSSFDAELALLKQAKAALNAGDADGALATLAEHKRRFPRGLFAEERQAMRIVALCDAGRVAEGRRAAKRFLKKRPKSAFVDRVRAACPEPE